MINLFFNSSVLFSISRNIKMSSQLLGKIERNAIIERLCASLSSDPGESHWVSTIKELEALKSETMKTTLNNSLE
jgi:hypothetical protein